MLGVMLICKMKKEKTLLLDPKDHMMIIETEEEVVEEVMVLMEVVAENVSNAIKKVTWLENVQMKGILVDQEVVEDQESAINVTRKVIWQENAPMKMLLLKEVIEVEEGSEAEEETLVAVVALDALNAEKVATLQENALMSNLVIEVTEEIETGTEIEIEKANPTKGREEMMVVQ